MHTISRRPIVVSMLLFVFFLLGTPVFAQTNELAVTAGGYFPFNSSFGVGNAVAVGGSFAHRLASVPFVALYAEIPIYGTLGSVVNTAGTPAGLLRANNYSALFITPGVKVKIAPSFPLSPYVLAGGGWARFHKNYPNTSADQSTTTGTFEVGGGIDSKIFPYLSLRTEIRDYYTGSPQIQNNFTDRTHQIVATAGIVLRF